MRLSDPSIYSILFISLVELIYIIGASYFVSLLLKRKLTYPFDYSMYIVIALLVLLNYLIVYRKAKQYDYYTRRINTILMIVIIILGYVIMGIGGQMYRQFFSNV